MSETTKDIISDEEVERVHANANFGFGWTKRGILDAGVLTYALGYSTGSTLMSILVEHRLIQKPRPHTYRARLTQKGFRYLRAMMGDTKLHEIQAVMRGAA